MSKPCHANHPDHSAEISRLNRMAGQVEGIKSMIQDQRYCPDIITQLRAVQSAAKAIEANILRRHLEACVKDAFSASASDDEQTRAQQQKIDELIRMFKKLD